MRTHLLEFDLLDQFLRGQHLSSYCVIFGLEGQQSLEIGHSLLVPQSLQMAYCSSTANGIVTHTESDTELPVPVKSLHIFRIEHQSLG